MSAFSYATDMKGKYFKIDFEKKTYTNISETDFYKATPYKKTDLVNLTKSVYPNQTNDYLLLKKDGLTFPVDYKLVPLVKFFWKKGFATQGWNQPDTYNQGFVSFHHYLKNGESTLCVLEELLGKLDYKILNHFDGIVSNNSIQKMVEKETKLHKKGLFVLSIESNYVSLSFSEPLMEKLYKKLDLSLNEKRLPGGAILSEYDLQGFRKVK